MTKPGDSNSKTENKKTGVGGQSTSLGEHQGKDDLDQDLDEERDADPGQRQKQNQGEQKDDDLAA